MSSNKHNNNNNNNNSNNNSNNNFIKILLKYPILHLLDKSYPKI